MTTADPGPTRPATPRPPTGPKPATPRPATPRKGHLPIALVCDCGHEGLELMWHMSDCPVKRGTALPSLADLIRDVSRLLKADITMLARQYELLPIDEDPFFAGVAPFADRKLGNAVANIRAALDDLNDVAELLAQIPARQGLPARGPGGPSDQGPLPGRTVTAGSAAAGGSAQGLGRSTGAGSKPGRSPGRAEDVAAPVAHPGGSPETAAAVLGAGAPIRHADGSFSLPVWPGTARAVASIAQQVAAEAQRRSG